jgi:hypothetical protein
LVIVDDDTPPEKPTWKAIGGNEGGGERALDGPVFGVPLEEFRRI